MENEDLDTYSIRGVPKETRRLFAKAAKSKGIKIGALAGVVMREAAEKILSGEESDNMLTKFTKLSQQIEEIRHTLGMDQEDQTTKAKTGYHHAPK